MHTTTFTIISQRVAGDCAAVHVKFSSTTHRHTSTGVCGCAVCLLAMSDCAVAFAVAQSEGATRPYADGGVICIHLDTMPVETEDDAVIDRPLLSQLYVIIQIVVACLHAILEFIRTIDSRPCTCGRRMGLIGMHAVRATDEMIRMLACLHLHKRRRVHRIANILPTRHIQPGNLLVGQLCHSLVNGSQQRLNLVRVLRRHLVRQGINKCLRILYIGVCIARVAAADIVTADGIAGGGELLLFCHCSRVLCKGRRGLHGKAESKCHEQT